MASVAAKKGGSQSGMAPGLSLICSQVAVCLAIPFQLDDQTQLGLAQQGLDRADDAHAAPDLDRVAHLEGVLRAQMSRGDDLVRVTKLEAIDHSVHSREALCPDGASPIPRRRRSFRVRQIARTSFWV